MKVMIGLLSMLALTSCSSKDTFTLYVPKGASIEHCSIEHHLDNGISIYGCDVNSASIIYPGVITSEMYDEATR